MLRTCTTCHQEKELEKFVKGDIYNGTQYYRYKCKECLNKTLRTGRPNTGRFQKGTNLRLGKKHTEESKKKISEVQKGRKQTPETVEKRRQKHLSIGKGRQSHNYEVWRNKVLERDGHKCVKCGSENRLHCHHLIAWKDDETKRLEVENGQTLCAACHAKEGYEKGEIKLGVTQFKKFSIPWNKGKLHSEEAKRKMSDSLKGRVPWNKG